MSDGYETTVTIGDREVTVRELSVREIRNLAKESVAKGQDDFVANALVEDAPFYVLSAFTDVSEEDFEDWRPSDIRKLRDKCKEANPDFFDLNRRVAEAMAMTLNVPSDDLTKISQES